MKSVGAFEAKTHLSRLLREVEQHRERIMITRNNRNVACLVPCDGEDQTSELRQRILEGLDAIRNAQEPLRGGIKELIEDGRKR